MKHIKGFNENIEDSNEEPKKMQVKVKHLIEYLSQLDPEANVYLDKDGWDTEGENEVEMIKNRGVFDFFQGSLFINN